uniref:Probable transcriptional regulatory protein MAGMO_2994 n=1 Tax=Magnetococcus massalia (strain MO-1) TaxID=451514 RepID=A0A1S7LJX2_MAGMO|nr:Conserved hypothetical protein; YebC-like [Candidatus Magnetococcus massalia]
MAGHSKWANIKHRKGAQDAKRGKIFTRLIKEITVAARMGGGDADSNPRLRGAISAARAQNLPKDTMEKAIKRGTGELEGVSYEEVGFEGYGPGGVAVMVNCLTDNNNRTVSEVRHIFAKFGGNMGTTGCVAFMFDKVGQIMFEREGIDEDALMEATLEAGADDMIAEEGGFEVLTDPDAFSDVIEALAAAGYDKPVSAEITMRPQNTQALDEKQAASMMKLMDKLEENEDVQNVYANYDISDEIMEKLG